MGKKRPNADVPRVMALLNTVVAVSGRTKSSLEQELGLASGYMSRILARSDDISLNHLLNILAALGVDAGAFFRRACRRAGPGAGANLIALMNEEAEKETEQQVLRALGNLLAAAGQLPPAVPAPAKPLPEPVSKEKRRARRTGASGPARSG
jgi:transcriptional regulator with XRE-family HTH domain